MTAEEIKAKELVTKFKNILPRMGYIPLETSAMACAIICVEEIIVNCGTSKNDDPIFWHRVREHLKSGI